MFRLIVLGLGLLIALISAAHAGERQFLGHGRLVDNDVFVGRKDRWQTGSVAASYVWGPEWRGALPTVPGQVIELRLLGQLIAPESLRAPKPGDRPYANALSFGLHTHYDLMGAEVAAGGDLVLTGDQTQLYRIQQGLHDLMGIAGPGPALRAAGIGNGVHPSAVLEIGRALDLGAARLRPFVEGRAGVETIARAGVDLTLGRIGRGLSVRDPVTGQRYRTIKGQVRGFTVVMGADYAKVTESVFLPEPRYRPLDRARLRAGLHWEGKRGRAFYGVTWLSEEFAGQRDSQIVGSLRIDLDF